MRLPGRQKLTSSEGGAARLKVVVLLAAVLALQSADGATVGAVASPLESGLHLNNTDIGLLVTVSTLVGAVATLPGGVLVDKVKRTRLLSIAIVIWSAAMVVSGLASSFSMLLLTRLALGAVVAVASPAVASLTGDFFPAGERGRIYGFILSGELLGAGFGFLISGNVAAIGSWRASFVVLAIPGIFLASIIWRRLPEPARGGQSRLPAGASHIVDEDEAEDRSTAPASSGAGGGPETVEQARGADDVVQEVKASGVQPHNDRVLRSDPSRMRLPAAVKYVLSIRTNVVLIVGSSLGYFYFSGVKTFATVFLRGRFQLGQSLGSTLLVVIGAGALIGVLITGRLADWLIRRGHVSARPVVASVALLVAGALFLAGLLTTDFLIAFPLLFFAAAAIGGTNPPLDSARLDIMTHRLWGRAEAVRTFLRSIFQASSPLVIGFVSVAFGGHNAGLGGATGRSVSRGAPGLDAALLIMLVPLFAGGLVLLKARRTYPPDVATAVSTDRYTDRRLE